MFEVISVIFWGLVLITAIVFIHEVGHYLAARAFGLRVKEFMIGLPGPRITFKRKETRFGVTAIPLGGYCLIAGMEKGEEGPEVEKALAFIAYYGRVTEDQADRAGDSLGFDLISGLDVLHDWGTVRRYKAKRLYHYEIAEATINGEKFEEGQSRKIANFKEYIASEKKLTYSAMPWWKRMVVLLGGSFANLVVAMAILIVLLMVNGSQAPTTVIDSVVEGSPAAAAGLMPGDELLSINNESFDTWDGFVEALQQFEVGDTISLGYSHNDETQRVRITLADNNGTPLVGVSPEIVRESLGFLEAAQISVSFIGFTLTAILQLINPATFSQTLEQSTSVVGISMEASAAAAAGPVNFILLIAALSVSIGFVNLLPVPPLDGGKIIIETIERVTRRRLPRGVLTGIYLAGWAALLLLLIVLTNQDIQRYFLGG
ncbi:MAG: M50 family metallopeptidase [Coriobacteriia bacterium]|nr:M50 family metallopeptidase [Coriobacteriia bacterium]MCL2749659.1 M50 family metallopeptidase [Coriobacteriia bacterium]